MSDRGPRRSSRSPSRHQRSRSRSPRRSSHQSPRRDDRRGQSPRRDRADDRREPLQRDEDIDAARAEQKRRALARASLRETAPVEDERNYRYPSPDRVAREAAADASAAAPPPPKAKPNFALSGKLYDEVMTNDKGVVVKYADPADAAPPSGGWRVYVFKQGVEGIQGMNSVKLPLRGLVACQS